MQHRREDAIQASVTHENLSRRNRRILDHSRSVIGFPRDDAFGEMGATAVHWIGTFRWLYDYQTLIALVGAWWAASAVHAQIRQAKQIEQQRIDTKRAALRAALPFTLGSLSEYADTCAKYLSDLMGQTVEGLLPATVPIPDFPKVPSTAVANVTDLIEVATDNERVFPVDNARVSPDSKRTFDRYKAGARPRWAYHSSTEPREIHRRRGRGSRTSVCAI
ncbi:hypothetical protein GGE16_001516 [Rhizobium leguminosarum]|uniref:Uncharacterized protein n=1 Tax=Rhizobium leguminosarum TaxID=384 RepID=A0AAE2MI21_RHILE|nr:hypothetical protein [Rhizobium leguminosarum]MBB4433467.1 hypothetical protein [Rhizobium esperanzae]MBB4294404.1 hypothetical protein [Rhizobium leguminosarum]MBB4305800.1 hypothetical protein [Rhizobium leguminosarum]MBB4418623.1 hypothetical protein [Rhizobium leguminosarum]